MRVLFITDEIPYPPVSGNLLRTYNLCQRLAREHEVWLAAPLNNREEAPGVLHMQSFCHAVVTALRPRQSYLQHLPGLLRYAWEGKPLEFKFEHCQELVDKIRQMMATVQFDVVHIEPSYMGLYVEALPPGAQCKKFLTFHNIESSLFRQLARVSRKLNKKVRTLIHSLMLRRWEASYLARFDGCITVSEIDRRLLLAANPRLHVCISPNGFDIQKYQPLPVEDASPRLMFVGSMDYGACVDAMLFFCGEVLPQIQQAVKEVEMWIVGRDPAPAVQQLGSNRVHITGWVDDVIPYYSRSTVCVVPLRAGGGTRLKILEAMALGRPVVSTAKGCEGLDVVDGEHLFIADTPEQFAAKTVRLLIDPVLRKRMVKNARELVENAYNWDAIVEQLIQFYVATPANIERLHPNHPLPTKGRLFYEA
jgi:sugar transferase (PEP-CTERM/EpsH1 system associated)